MNNFINFSELYDTGERALFETGSLLIDGRWFNLALKTDDVNAHSAIAKTSNIFTLYLEITNKDAAQKFTVAVPATSGSRGNLVTGKRGVFFDLDNREYDARIISIIENPISLREALALPFKRLWGFIIGKIEAISNTSEKNLQKATDALFKQDSASPQAASANAAPATMLVGLSVSIAALGSAFAFISNTLSGMSSYQLYLSLLGAAAVVIVPVSLVAALKLARQDMSSLLEGCGWAINSRMRFNNRLRRQITHHAPYPDEAEGTPPSPWLKIFLTIAAVCLVFLGIQKALKSSADAPANKAPSPVTQTANPAAD